MGAQPKTIESFRRRGGGVKNCQKASLKYKRAEPPHLLNDQSINMDLFIVYLITLLDGILYAIFDPKITILTNFPQSAHTLLSLIKGGGSFINFRVLCV